MTTVGSLFTGYGGLDMGVMTALDLSARIAWTSDIEPGPCKLAAVRWPDTPYLGDIIRVDWDAVEPVDIICGGSPCQDLSVAGKRAGMAPGTRSGLWKSMFAAIKTIRARLFVIGYPHGEPWGLPDGHVTGTDLALPREQQLRLLGNGAVPQQAALAVRTLTETALRYGAAQ